MLALRVSPTVSSPHAPSVYLAATAWGDRDDLSIDKSAAGMLRTEDHLCVQYLGRLLRLCTSGVVDLLLTSAQHSPDLVELEEMLNDLIFDSEDVSGLLLWAL